MKPCTKCKEGKQFSEFPKRAAAKDGLAYWCRVCVAEYNRGYRRTHKEEAAEYQKGYYQTPTGKATHRRGSKKYSQTPAGKAAQKRGGKRQRELCPERMKANNAVNHAIAAGKLERPSTCEQCKEERDVHGHHEDYSKSLEVQWLCEECHTELHRLLREIDMKKTLLRRKLNFIADETAEQIMDLFDRNREVGKRPDNWSYIKSADEFNDMLKHCPELDSIYAAALDRDVEELNQAAELMTEEEFLEIQRTDSRLAGKLLNGPEAAFCFPLSWECLKQVEELRLIRGTL